MDVTSSSTTATHHQEHHHHDTHATPPEYIQDAYIHYNTIKRADLDADPDVIDFGRGLSHEQKALFKSVGSITASTITAACIAFRNAALHTPDDDTPLDFDVQDVTIYEHKDFPGLQITPAILPPETQVLFVSRILHQCLAEPSHKINVDTDYDVQYPPLRPHKDNEQTAEGRAERSSFFTLHPSIVHASRPQHKSPSSSSSSTAAAAINNAHSTATATASNVPASDTNLASHTYTQEHGDHNDNLDSLSATSSSRSGTRSATTTATTTSNNRVSQPRNLNTAQLLRKLRYLTIGAQYHWPTRSYPRHPSESPTQFPPDISLLVSTLFSHTQLRPESGVVLLYGGKDYMPVHRDVSEQCERGLASFSLGCDGIFLVGQDIDVHKGTDEHHHRHHQIVAIRVRSGDCVHMDGPTRWAWHAMPRTLVGTGPDCLARWPVGTPGATRQEEHMYTKWKGYMASKRLNISCRQVWN